IHLFQELTVCLPVLPASLWPDVGRSVYLLYQESIQSRHRKDEMPVAHRLKLVSQKHALVDGIGFERSEWVFPLRVFDFIHLGVGIWNRWVWYRSRIVW